jgi:hypothetical protein
MIGTGLALLAATAGCPGTLEDPAEFLAPLDDAAAGDDAGGRDSTAIPPAEDGGACPDVPDLFATTCASSSCHSASNKAQGLDLQSADVAARLVDVPATEGPGLLIDPSAPSKSIVYLKLTASPPFGARMPLGEAPLDVSTLACVRAWITEEASTPDAGADAIDDANENDGGSE